MLLVLSIVLAAIAASVVWLLWARSRRKHVHFPVPPGAHIDTLIRSFAALTWGYLTDGNRVTVVQNSGFFDALLADVAGAQRSVHLETFLWQDGHVSDRVAATLADKAREGVAVRVLVDQRGAAKTSPRVWAQLRTAGCEFRVYHRMRLRELAWANNRDHRKIAVIDGRIGYTFGHGIADMWGASEHQPTGWRDTAARIEGPAVNHLQAAFLDNWVKVTREALIGDEYFPEPHRPGDTRVHVAWIAQPETISSVRRLYELAISAAKREIILQNPYFIPSQRAINLCAAAVARGVEIKLMLPTATTSDFAVVQHASHAHYGQLLAAGARIFEYTRSGIHQKVMIIDREWCTIGSTNFDPRSFNINDEISVAIYDAAIAQELAAEFETDLTGAEEWTLERFHGRTPWHRVVDAVSTIGKRQL
ncbi:MAG TPA: phospholipase D-like domain-containing protein [Thermoanaerobaculia bacterium]|nr:phospholipase D-like domain-containing protein [Thermoanaerobaculia bacterium]